MKEIEIIKKYMLANHNVLSLKISRQLFKYFSFDLFLEEASISANFRFKGRFWTK